MADTPARSMQGALFKERPLLTTLCFAFFLTFFWGVMPAFLVAGSVHSRVFPVWVLVIPAIVLPLTMLWLHPRVVALTRLQRLVVPETHETIRGHLTRAEPTRQAIWAEGGLAAFFVGLVHAPGLNMALLGAWFAADPGLAGDEGRVTGAVLFALGAAWVWAASKYPKRSHEAIQSLRRYIDSGMSDEACLLAAAEVISLGDVAGRSGDTLAQAPSPDASAAHDAVDQVRE